MKNNPLALVAIVVVAAISALLTGVALDHAVVRGGELSQWNRR
jgi:hypothetical protein